MFVLQLYSSCYYSWFVLDDSLGLCFCCCDLFLANMVLILEKGGLGTLDKEKRRYRW